LFVFIVFVLLTCFYTWFYFRATPRPKRTEGEGVQKSESHRAALVHGRQCIVVGRGEGSSPTQKIKNTVH